MNMLIDFNINSDTSR